MEPEGLGEIRVELRSHDARLTANHDAIGRLRERTAEHGTKIEVITTELRETREDIGQLATQLASNSREVNGKLSGQSKAFFTAAAAMGGMMLSICGLIAVLLANHA